MSYSDSYPSVRPLWQLDASNGGRIPPNATFSRSDTPPTYAAPSAVHYMSNEKHLSSDNLLLQSSDFDTSWTANGLNGTPTGGQADPSGGTDGFTLVESSGAGERWLQQAVSGSGTPTLTVYAKQNSGTRYLYLTIWNSVSNFEVALFDLAGGAAALYSGGSSSFTSVTATQTASGNGFYKCTLKATGTANLVYVGVDDSSTITGYNSAYGVKSYTGNGSSIDIAFASLTSSGATDYQPTTTQIHRKYAPTLKSVSYAGQPRFEYDPTDGESEGILIEGQAQNLLTYSSDLSNAAFTPNNVSVTTEAIAPNGTLSAVAVREDGSLDQHRINQAWAHAGGYFTISVYAKAIGSNRRLLIREGFVTGSYASFDLNTGTVTSQGAGGTGAIESVGNGWYRCSMASNIGANTLLAMFYLLPSTGTTSSDATYTGDYYSGLLLAMAQAENQVWASSWISTSGSAVTRASDQLSVATADIGYTGGDFSLIADATNPAENGVVIAEVGDGTASNSARLVARVDGTPAFTVTNSGAVQAYIGNTSSRDAKRAIRCANNNFGYCENGGTVSTDTAGVVPVTSTLYIGKYYAGAQLNGHIKRVALYGEALSDTNLQALTS